MKCIRKTKILFTFTVSITIGTRQAKHQWIHHINNGQGKDETVNYADTLNGAQIGLFNVARKRPKGGQIVGRLWITPILDKKGMAGEFGIYQHYNYYEAKPIKDGSDLIPYRISEAAGFGPGFILALPHQGALSMLEQRIFLSGILLGGAKSDYFNVLDRDYNMGSGFSIKSKTQLDFGHFGRFILNAKYFRIFTWKGYENKDLQAYADGTLDINYLSAQGDKSNAALFVVNPVMEFHLARQWSVCFLGAYYFRRTHYKYYDTVRANTFETKLGITCRL